MALGRGLGSLIPGRKREEAEAALEQIDSLEYDENTEVVESSQKEAKTSPVDVVEDFEELEGTESDFEIPSKPLVTPLEIDPTDMVSGKAKVSKKKSAKITVMEEDDEDSSDVVSKVEVEEEVVAEAPKVSMLPQEMVDEIKEEESKEEPKKKSRLEELLFTPQDEPDGDDIPASEEETPIEPEPSEEAPPVAKKAVKKPAPTTRVEEAVAAAATPNERWDRHEGEVQHIPIGNIEINPLQPRRTFDPQEMAELVESIDKHGILQPLVVRRIGEGKYELIAGERRLRASKQLKWEKVPAVVRVQVEGNETRLVYALIENIQRENLNPIEEAQAYDQLNREYGLTHEEIGERLGKTRVGITNAMRVLQLPAEIQRGLAEGVISMGHAKAILMIPDPDKQLRFYQHLVDEGLTVRKAEIRARRIQRAMKVDDPMRRRRNRGRHQLSVQYSPKLEERYGFGADVKFLADKNRYEVVLKAYSDSEIHQLLNRLMGAEELPVDVDSDVLGEEEEE